MPKLKLPDIDAMVAIDIHTHAKEPCACMATTVMTTSSADGGLFKSPHKHPPTVPETAAYYRAKKIAAVIFPVDPNARPASAATNNHEMLEVASEHLDVLIPFVSSIRTRASSGARGAEADREYGVAASNSIRPLQGFYPNDRMAYPCTRRSTKAARSRCSIRPDRSASGMPGGMGIGLKYSNPMYMDDVAATSPI